MTYIQTKYFFKKHYPNEIFFKLLIKEIFSVLIKYFPTLNHDYIYYIIYTIQSIYNRALNANLISLI